MIYGLREAAVPLQTTKISRRLTRFGQIRDYFIMNARKREKIIFLYQVPTDNESHPKVRWGETD